MWESGVNWFVPNAFYCALALVLTLCNTFVYLLCFFLTISLYLLHTQWIRGVCVGVSSLTNETIKRATVYRNK